MEEACFHLPRKFSVCIGRKKRKKEEKKKHLFFLPTYSQPLNHLTFKVLKDVKMRKSWET